MLEMLKGKKTYILVLLAAGITAYQNIVAGTLDLEAAQTIVYTFMVASGRAAASSLEAVLKEAIGTGA